MATTAGAANGGRAYEQLAARLRDEILSGRLGPGDRLPSETQLATRAGVSRSTVREALRTLQEAGYVERASPKIMVVRRHDDESAQRELVRALHRRNVTFDRLHEALVLLEPELSRLAAQRAEPGDVRELEANLAAQERHLTDFGEWSRLDQDFHLAIAEIADNPALILARAPVSRLLMPALYRFVRSQAATAAALRWHRRILDEIAAGDGEAAALMARRHVDDFRAAWEHAGLDFHQQVGELAEDVRGGRT